MKQNRDVVAVTVRSSSTRLPNKCHLPIGSIAEKTTTILEHVIQRLVREGFEVFVCTSDRRSDDSIASVADELEVGLFRGSLGNKASRWYSFMEVNSLSHAHFLDCDDPFYCATEVSESLKLSQSTNLAVLPSLKSESGNASVGGTLTFELMTSLMKKVGSREDFEMVFPYLLREFPGSTLRLQGSDPLPEKTRLTVDYFDDYLFTCMLWRLCEDNYSRGNIRQILEVKPWLSEINQACNDHWKNRQEEISQLEKVDA
jgi:spore coat polysaccharide biosynthesis protein SpsF (cytidylyltransferase family)